MSKKRLYVYDCHFGQSMVVASSEEEARREALLDAGRSADVHNVREADNETIQWHRSMGGYVPEI